MRFPLQIQSSKNLPFLLVYMYCIFFLLMLQSTNTMLLPRELRCNLSPWELQLGSLEDSGHGQKMSRGKPCPNLGQAAKFPREKSCLLNHYLHSVKVSKHYNKFALRSSKAEREADVIPPDRPRFLAGSYSTILDSFRFWILVYNNKMTSPCWFC